MNELQTFAVATWNQRISPVFDTTTQIQIITAKQKKILSQISIPLPPFPPHARLDAILQHDARTLLCGAISRPLHHLIHAHQITIFPFLSGPADEIIQRFLDHALPDPRYLMPGCRTTGFRFGNPQRGARHGRGGCSRYRRGRRGEYFVPPSFRNGKKD